MKNQLRLIEKKHGIRKLPFQIKLLPENVILLEGNKTLFLRYICRFQESFEHPHFGGKFFTHEQYRKHCLKHHGITNLAYRWAGAYLTSREINLFVRSSRPRFSKEERAFLDVLLLCKEVSKRKYGAKRGCLHIIATEGRDLATVRHELAHLLYNEIPGYRKRINAVFRSLPQDTRRELVASMYRIHYAKYRHSDEIHAYVMENDKALRDPDPLLSNDRAFRKDLAAARRKYRKEYNAELLRFFGKSASRFLF